MGGTSKECVETRTKDNVEERESLHDAVLFLIDLSCDWEEGTLAHGRGECIMQLTARHFYWDLVRDGVGRKTFDIRLLSV